MSHEQFVVDYESASLGYFISVPKAFGMLVAYRIRDARFLLLLTKWTCGFVGLVIAAVCAFTILPMFLAVGIFALGICLYGLLCGIGAGDIFLKFALEDEWFFALAIGRRALSIFEETELSLPQPRKFAVPEDNKSKDSTKVACTARHAEKSGSGLQATSHSRRLKGALPKQDHEQRGA